jgi:hypothetical protein
MRRIDVRFKPFAYAVMHGGAIAAEGLAMMASTHGSAGGGTSHLLRFRSLFDEGRGLAFPCDAVGQVDLDCMSERARNNYLYARTVIGREFRNPEVENAAPAH